MAYVPGTEIEKPAVDLINAISYFDKVHRCKKGLRRAGVPENIITTFLEIAAANMLGDMNSVIANYVEPSYE